jgi:serine/threonine protein phosphatase PrpC
MDNGMLTHTTVVPSAGSLHRWLQSTTMELPGLVRGIGISDTGTQRGENQDGFRMAAGAGKDGRPRALFAVADGMGGLSEGRFASHIALQVFFESFLRNPAAPVKRALREAMEEADFGLQQMMHKLAIRRMGTTLTAACLEGSRLFLAHIGDSRAYLLRADRAECLTHDHTTVGEMVRMHILSPEKARTHDRRSELTRGLGLSMFIRPDITSVDLRANDRILLCTDGVWSALEEREIAECSAGAAEPQEFGRSLIDRAMERGSDDNVSAVILEAIHKPAGESVANGTPRGWLGRLRRR